jgi:hypothetical protein
MKTSVSSKRVVVSVSLLSFLVSGTAGILAQVPLETVLGRAALVSAVFGSASVLILLLTERA